MITIPECFYRVSVKALILDESGERFLLFQESDGKWDFPGGGLDFGESVQGALKRELFEEAGLVLTELSGIPRCVIPWNWKGETYALYLFYEVKIKDLNFTPSEECQAIGFFSIEEMKILKGSGVLPLFAQCFYENH